MAILNSYVKLPEGNYSHESLFWMMCFLLETLASTFICWGSLTTGLKYPRIQGIIHSINTNHRLQKDSSKRKKAPIRNKKHQFLKLSMLHTLQHGNTICLKPSFFKLWKTLSSLVKRSLRLHFEDLAVAVGTGQGCDGPWMVEFPIVFLWFCSFSIYGKTKIPHLLISQLTL